MKMSKIFWYNGKLLEKVAKCKKKHKGTLLLKRARAFSNNKHQKRGLFGENKKTMPKIFFLEPTQ